MYSRFIFAHLFSNEMVKQQPIDGTEKLIIINIIKIQTRMTLLVSGNTAEVSKLRLQRTLGVEIPQACEHHKEVELQQLLASIHTGKATQRVLRDDERHVVAVEFHLRGRPLQRPCLCFQRRSVGLSDLNQGKFVSLDATVVLKFTLCPLRFSRLPLLMRWFDLVVMYTHAMIMTSTPLLLLCQTKKRHRTCLFRLILCISMLQ